MNKEKQKTKNNDSLGNRMKNYESINRNFLIPKLYTVIRIDGRAFHTYTKRFKRPFDKVLIDAMDETAKYLCSKIQGAKFSYVQSDEITIFISDMETIEEQMWYGGNIQKMVSVSASMATAKFNHIMFLKMLEDITTIDEKTMGPKYKMDGLIEVDVENLSMAEFDSRVFQLPNQYEVFNCVLWRQQDATRNSVSAVAQSLYSPKELHGVSCNGMQELIFQKGINWNEYDPKLKRGRFIDKITYVNGVKIESIEWYNNCVEADKKLEAEGKERMFTLETDKVRTKWESLECPIFTEDREFLLSKIK